MPRTELTPQDRIALIERIAQRAYDETENKSRKDGTCASHDHCDANVYMDAAFACVLGQGVDQSDAATELWGVAWDIAKKNGFAKTVQQLQLADL